MSALNQPQPVIPYHDLFKHMLNGVAYCRMVFDEQDNPVDFVYLYVDPAFEKITGLKWAPIINRRGADAIPGINYPKALELKPKVYRGRKLFRPL